MSAAVLPGPNGKHRVVVDGRVVGEHDTNAAAWRQADLLDGQLINKAQATADWVFHQQLGRGDLYRAKPTRAPRRSTHRKAKTNRKRGGKH